MKESIRMYDKTNSDQIESESLISPNIEKSQSEKVWDRVKLEFRKPVTGLLLFYLIVHCLTNIFSKKVSIIIVNYPFLLTQMSPFVGFLCYASISFVRYKLGKLPEIARSFPLYKAFFVGLLFSCHNLLNYMGNRGNAVAGPVAVLILQGIVPVTMVMSIVLLKKRYSYLHYIGVCVILAGIVITLWPNISAHSIHKLYGAILIVISLFPLASALIYLERNLKDKEYDVVYLWGWVCVFQFFIGFILSPIDALLQGVPIREFPRNFYEGLRCMFALHNGPNDTDCRYALMWYLIFVPVGIADNLTMAYGVKKASALLVWIVSTMSVPLTNILFAFHWVMGEYTTPFTIFNIFGLFAVVIGLVIYRVRPELGPKQELDVQNL